MLKPQHQFFEEYPSLKQDIITWGKHELEDEVRQQQQEGIFWCRKPKDFVHVQVILLLAIRQSPFKSMKKI
jgi:hypothetical protein